jgi:ABC-2 type transport system ATP-binding protein
MTIQDQLVSRSERTAGAGEPSVVVDGLSKTYRNGVRAAKSISFDAYAGEVVGLLGPNGAGKSTTLKMCATLLQPTDGAATVCGHRLQEVNAVRPLLGVALQDAGLDPLMTGLEHFDIQAALYRVPADVAKKRTGELLERFGLTSYANSPAGMYSGGTQRRLSLALALVHDPPVVIFDEPTAGLDPRSRRDVWTLINGFREERRVVVFSTQYLEEADLLCDRVYLVDGGSVVAWGAPADLKHTVGSARLRVRVNAPPTLALDVFRAELPSITGTVEGDHLLFTLEETTDLALDVLRVARANGLGIDEIELRQPSLDDVFLHYTGRVLEPEPLSGPGIDMGTRTLRGGGKRWK